MKILITSVGSLVGQNVLDVLNYPGLSRRDLVEVVGTNSLPESPSNFLCDRCYLVPETASVEFAERLAHVLAEEVPDLILCGRDEDTVAVSRLKAQRPELPGALPCADPEAAFIAFDKRQTSLFARENDLPFAESFTPCTADFSRDLLEFCRRVGYPVIAKPVRGFGSRGVFFLRDEGDVQALSSADGLLFQEYLGEPESLAPYFKSLNGPAPLFAQAPLPGHYSCHTLVSPQGRVSEVFTMYNHHEYGHTVWNRRVYDAALDRLTLRYADRLITKGARGPINVQFRSDRRGQWKAQEINLRNTGSTLSRFLLGLDELFLIARDFVPGAVFPEASLSPGRRGDRVIKRYLAYPLAEEAVGAMRNSGVWSRV
jgi:hypothetical protein